MAVVPGIALTLRKDSALRKHMNLEFWIGRFGLGLAFFTGAGHLRPELQLLRGWSQPVGARAKSKAGM